MIWQVVIWNNYVDLSDTDVDLSALYIDLLDVMSTWRIILLSSVWH